MDICNKLSPKKFAVADDFLTFISIYEDKKREQAYRRLLRAERAAIKGQVCVEAGSGMGVMSEELVRLGAKKVYAVEINPLMAGLLRERLAGLPRVQVVESDIADFDPGERIDVLIHEFYGQLLFDEELTVLSKLKFRPKRVIPDSGRLLCGVTPLRTLRDRLITPAILTRLDGLLVSGLFDEGRLKLKDKVLDWRFGAKVSCKTDYSLSGDPGELLYFGVTVNHRGKEICRAGRCPNWSFVWTFRKGNRFSLDFSPGPRAPEPVFRWLKE